jgi:hypothetical protein
MSEFSKGKPMSNLKSLISLVFFFTIAGVQCTRYESVQKRPDIVCVESMMAKKKNNPDVENVINALFEVAYVRNFIDYSWCNKNINFSGVAYFNIDTNGTLKNIRFTESIDTMPEIKKYILEKLFKIKVDN